MLHAQRFQLALALGEALVQSLLPRPRRLQLTRQRLLEVRPRRRRPIHLRGQAIALGLERRHRHAQLIALGRERLQPRRCTRGLRRLLRPHPLELVLPLREPVDQSLLPRPRRLQPPLQRLLEVCPRRPCPIHLRGQTIAFHLDRRQRRTELVVLRRERFQARSSRRGLCRVRRPQRLEFAPALREPLVQALLPHPRRLQPLLQRLREVRPRRRRPIDLRGQAVSFDFESGRGRPQLVALRGERLQALPDGGRLRGVLRE